MDFAPANRINSICWLPFSIHESNIHFITYPFWTYLMLDGGLFFPLWNRDHRRSSAELIRFHCHSLIGQNGINCIADALFLSFVLLWEGIYQRHYPALCEFLHYLTSRVLTHWSFVLPRTGEDNFYSGVGLIVFFLIYLWKPGLHWEFKSV